MRYELSQKEVWAIQETLNEKGRPAVEIKIEDGKIAIIRIDRRLVKK